MMPDVNEALRFLDWLRPNGPWLLGAFENETRRHEFKTFSASEKGDLARWVTRLNCDSRVSAEGSEWNVYYSVNPTMRTMTKKAAREDIFAATHLFVDIDPRAEAALADEQHRIARQLQDFSPKASAIIYSGGGYQALWRLAEPLLVQGDPHAAERAAAYNRGLEQKLIGADSCHNVDRIFRLPGTINWPNANKRAKGRSPAVASIIHMNGEIYDLSAFSPLTESARGPSVSLNIGAPRSLDDLSALDQWNVPDRTKVIISQGRHPDEGAKAGDDSRSAWLFDALCELVRCSVPNEVILGLLMDRAYGWSAHIFDTGKSNPKRYAERQIERAHEFAIAPELTEMNDRHAVIANYGNRTRILDESGPIFQTQADFKLRYKNRTVLARVDGEEKKFPLDEWWLRHPKRREYSSAEFLPGNSPPPNIFNLWRGFNVESRIGCCEKFLAFVREVICAGNDGYAEWVLNWMAHAVQRPEVPGEVAVVMRGGQGLGKSYFAEHFGELFNPHFVALTDPKHVTGSFNALLHNALVVFSDEAFAAHDKRAEGVLKGLVTQSHITIEPKGVDAFKARRFFRLIMSSNKRWVVPADVDDRRFLVLDVSEARKRDRAYFSEIEDEWTSGGREALMAFLLDRNIASFDHRDRPETTALQEQKLHSLNGARRAVFEMLSGGDAPTLEVKGQPPKRGSVFVRVPDLKERFGGTEKSIATELRHICIERAREKETPKGQTANVRGRWLLPLANAREAFADHVGFAISWPNDDGEWNSVEDVDAPF